MGNSNEIIKALSAPFSKDELHFRPGNVAKGKGTALALVYIDSRVVQERFDSVVGVENWQNRHICYDGKSDKVVCEISVRINGEWITKSDGAGDTAVEGEKGSFSDALKRAAVLWGVGRYLYECKNVWVPFDEEKKKFIGDPWTHFKFKVSPSKTENKLVTPPKAPNPPKQPVENDLHYIPIPLTADGGDGDWAEYADLLMHAIRDLPSKGAFIAFRATNSANMDHLQEADADLRKQVSEYASKKLRDEGWNKKAPIPPAHTGDPHG